MILRWQPAKSWPTGAAISQRLYEGRGRWRVELAAGIIQVETFIVGTPICQNLQQATMAPAIMGNPDRPELGEELTNSFCRTDPEIARQFARATFTSDNRADLPNVKARTLILQSSEDIIASEQGRRIRTRVDIGQQDRLSEGERPLPEFERT